MLLPNADMQVSTVRMDHRFAHQVGLKGVNGSSRNTNDQREHIPILFLKPVPNLTTHGHILPS